MGKKLGKLTKKNNVPPIKIFSTDSNPESFELPVTPINNNNNNEIDRILDNIPPIETPIVETKKKKKKHKKHKLNKSDNLLENNYENKSDNLLENNSINTITNMNYDSYPNSLFDFNCENGYEEVSENGYEEVSENGYEEVIENGYEEVIENGYEEVIENGYEEVIENGYEEVIISDFNYEEIINLCHKNYTIEYLLNIRNKLIEKNKFSKTISDKEELLFCINLLNTYINK